jgi:ArsR family transcriptional regulator, arsenate/arsenite/antimonite-responsive transcriptional repressor
VEPDLTAVAAVELAVVVKAPADPARLRIVDAVRKASPEAVCRCELLPLFEMPADGPPGSRLAGTTQQWSLG